MQEHRHVRLFRNGRNQAVRIPREFELDAEQAILRREGDALIIEPVPRRGLLSTLERLDDLDETFPDMDAELPPNDEIEL